MKVTYVENGIRQSRKCDLIERWPDNITWLVYFDGYDYRGNDLLRVNILAPNTIIERLEH